MQNVLTHMFVSSKKDIESSYDRYINIDEFQTSSNASFIRNNLIQLGKIARLNEKIFDKDDGLGLVYEVNQYYQKIIEEKNYAYQDLLSN